MEKRFEVSNLPTEVSVWTKIKNFLFYEITGEKVKNFLFQDIKVVDNIRL